MEKETTFPKGLFINPKRDGAPDFVVGSLSIRKEEFATWLSEQEVNEKGYLTIDILKSKEGKTYLKLNQWKPKEQSVAF